MAEQNQQTQISPLKDLENKISAAKNMKDLLAIDVIRSRYVKNYMASTKLKDGEERYERDMQAFMEKANANPDLLQCDPFSIFAAFIKMGSYAVTADKIYLQSQGVKQKDGSYKKMMKVDLTPFGKTELLERMPAIKHINSPMLVFKGDDFKYDPIKQLVVKHDQQWPTPNPSESTVIGVYCRIEYKDGRIVDVTRSLEELKKHRAASRMTDGGELWKTHYGEAAKKSVINHIFKTKYKQPDTAVLFSQYEPKDTEDIGHEEISVDDKLVPDAVIDVPEENDVVNSDPSKNDVVHEPTVVETPKSSSKRGKKSQDETEEEPLV